MSQSFVQQAQVPFIGFPFLLGFLTWETRERAHESVRKDNVSGQRMPQAALAPRFRFRGNTEPGIRLPEAHALQKRYVRDALREPHVTLGCSGCAAKIGFQ